MNHARDGQATHRRARASHLDIPQSANPRRPCTDPEVAILEASRCVLSATDHDHVRDMRDAGVRGVLVYCADYGCSHSVAQSAGRWADTLRRLWDIEPRFICKAGQGSLDLMSLFFS